MTGDHLVPDRLCVKRGTGMEQSRSWGLDGAGGKLSGPSIMGTCVVIS